MKKSLPINPIDNEDLYQLVSDAVSIAETKGASAVEVGASIDSGYSLTVRLGEVDVVEYHRDKSMGVSVYFGNRKGSASTNDFTKQALLTTIEKACHIARFTSEDPCNSLPPEEMMSFHYPDIPLYFPWDIPVETAIELTKRCEALAMASDPRINKSEGASLNTHQSFGVLANSLGFIGGSAGSRHSMSCSLIATENGNMERDYGYTSRRDHRDLETIEAIAALAAKRTINRLGARKIATQRIPVIFDSQIAPSLFGHFISAISGGNLYRKSSFLLDSLGKAVFPSHIEIAERPHLSKGLASAPFDGEGVITNDRDIVKDGLLQGYVLSHYSAQKLNMKTTGNAGGVHNLFISTSDMNLQQLLKQMQRGLLVTELIGHGVNIVNGDYSRGAFGYWVENGEIQYPVSEITIAGNLKDMFQNLVAIGNDFNPNSSFHVGSVLLSEMTVAGT